MYRLFHVTVKGYASEWRLNHQKRFGQAYFATPRGRIEAGAGRDAYWRAKEGYWSVNTKKEYAQVVLHLDKLRNRGLVEYVVLAPIKEN